MSKLSIIVATDQNGLIGNQGKLPWHIPWDLKYFKEKTLGANVIMGRTTYESIGKALPNRTNIILTSNKSFMADNCVVINNIDEVLRFAADSDKDTFIIGGSSIYEQTLALVDEMYMNIIQTVFAGDTYFPSYCAENWSTVKEQIVETTANNTSYKIKVKHLSKQTNKNMYK
ncbi:dihydrofolate reductase [Paenibacillus illinoisensis]|uniref:Dihydrofolate reductase n=1 Tax=Paenibacillus illinoisensis TaxID=59845 RepID=A0A2W0C6V6_9BACL|nr:dihydrofolate reductase [Paenibacillus illinoisensis]PYY28180.1 Dihydrofolate reductase [Paenibacillus illinoisensis]